MEIDKNMYSAEENYEKEDIKVSIHLVTITHFHIQKEEREKLGIND
ncbi:MAG: hypothetical protein QXL94_04805 [Candidatus Parvarchaeum sp.]